jgi:ATP-dependent DNA helicase RecG
MSVTLGDVWAEGADIDAPVQYLKGIGPKRAALLAKVGVETVGQLLFFVPRRYLDRSQMLAIANLQPGDEATVLARVVTAGTRRLKTRREVVSCMVRDESGMMEALWFNRPDLVERFRPNQEILLSGKVTRYRGLQLVNPMFELADEEGEFSFANAIIPVYPLTEGLSLWTIRRAIATAMAKALEQVRESLTPEMLEHYGYPGIRDALQAIHFPKDMESAERARERLVYDELLYFQLLLALRHREYATVHKAAGLVVTGQLTGPLLDKLHFRLTKAQERVLVEIKQDLASERCMNRLLQGDVGSGKTVVALLAMLVACENSAQAAMMAPTEILAEQHFLGWHERLSAIGVKSALLTGSTRAAERREIIAGLESGAVQIVFGTHALIEEEVKFNRLGLVVVDEQHRFGVRQRAALFNKGLNQDFLVMTATPIPRTLAMTLYGDLDSSVLDEKPPGRKPVVTKLMTGFQRESVYQATAKHLDEGEQAFVVCPLIEESEKMDLASAVKTFEETKAALPKHRVGLVHGRMKPEERGELMERFRKKEMDILVATSVIEVGVDVPDATVMIVEHPERFGLAQLHQLRGRIGRGNRQSFCILLASKLGLGDARERLEFFTRTSDGFELAEKDMEIRGPGEMLGTRQHGLPDLRIADIGRDRKILRQARRDAFRLVKLDPELKQSQNSCVKRTLLTRYYGRSELLWVG